MYRTPKLLELAGVVVLERLWMAVLRSGSGWALQPNLGFVML